MNGIGYPWGEDIMCWWMKKRMKSDKIGVIIPLMFDGDNRRIQN